MINLLPYKEKRLLGRIWRLRMVIVGLGAVIVLTIMGSLLFFPTLLLVNNRYALNQDQVKKLEARENFFSDTDLTALDHQAIDLEKKLKGATGNEPTLYVKKIQALTPSTISVSRYSIGDTTSPVVVIFGTAKTRSALESFVKALQGSADIKTIDSPINNYVKNTNADFTITVTFNTI